MLMAMELDQVEAFVAIVRGGGFTRAASILHLSQPAVSRRVELLERALGAPLFERMRSGAILTEAGRAFLPHAEGLLACMRDGVDAVRALHEVDRGTITLALVGTLASTTLTACLQRFRDAHPRVQGALAHGPQPGGDRAGASRRCHAGAALRGRSASRDALREGP
jgi:DNA-binding transcriptional LysR family regulator